MNSFAESRSARYGDPVYWNGRHETELDWWRRSLVGAIAQDLSRMNGGAAVTYLTSARRILERAFLSVEREERNSFRRMVRRGMDAGPNPKANVRKVG